jgi:hypothetical protein
VSASRLVSVPLLLSLSLLAGCGSVEERPAFTPSATPGSSSSAALLPSPTPSAPEIPADGRASAAAEAVAAMSDFVAHDQPYKAWWGAFSEHLTGAAAQGFETIDPAQIPATKVTDEGQVAGFPDGTSATVLVGTDAGQYRLFLIRETTEHPWFVDRLEPAEGGS